jgi:predicted enzyme related to lactoylglutathione lyase
MPEDWARPVVVFEIRGRDNKRTQDFYRQMFNWDIQTDANGIGRAEGGIGAPEPGPLSIYLQSDTPGVTPYIQVLDLRASMEKAKALRGQRGERAVRRPQRPDDRPYRRPGRHAYRPRAAVARRARCEPQRMLAKTDRGD